MNTTDQLITDYLDDLARMLVDLDPSDRDEILAGVRDHFVAAGEGSDGSPRVISEAIRRLGPPESVAAAARAEVTPAPGTIGGTSGEGAPLTIVVTRESMSQRIGWARTGIVLLAAATMTPLMLLALNALFTTSSTPDPGGWPASMGLFDANGEIAVVTAVLLAPVWLAGVILVATAQGLTPTHRVLLGSLGPITLISIGILVGLSGQLGRVAPAAAFGIAAALGLTYRTTWREAAETSSS